MSKKTKTDLENELIATKLQIAALEKSQEQISVDLEAARTEIHRLNRSMEESQKRENIAKRELATLEDHANQSAEILLRLSRFLTRLAPVFKEKRLTLVNPVVKHLFADDMSLSAFVDEYSDDIVALLNLAPAPGPFETSLFKFRPIPTKDDFAEFDVKLMDLGPKKLNVIKVIREHLSHLSLKGAKMMSEVPSGTVIATLPFGEASSMCKALEEVGAEAKIEEK